MMTYKISIDCHCKRRKKVLKHIVKSIFRNNRYKSGVNIEEEKLCIVSSDTDPAIHQTINIYDTRESISEAASIDVHFDRFGKKTSFKGIHTFITITFGDETSDQKFASTECIKLYNRLKKRIDSHINDSDYSLSLRRSYDENSNWITIICSGSRLTIPLIYV